MTKGIEHRDYFAMFEKLLREMQEEDVRAIAVVALTTNPEMRYLQADYQCGSYELKECAGILDMYAAEAFIEEGQRAAEMQEDDEEEDEDE